MSNFENGRVRLVRSAPSPKTTTRCTLSLSPLPTNLLPLTSLACTLCTSPPGLPKQPGGAAVHVRRQTLTPLHPNPVEHETRLPSVAASTFLQSYTNTDSIQASLVVLLHTSFIHVSLLARHCCHSRHIMLSCVRAPSRPSFITGPLRKRLKYLSLKSRRVCMH